MLDLNTNVLIYILYIYIYRRPYSCVSWGATALATASCQAWDTTLAISLGAQATSQGYQSLKDNFSPDIRKSSALISSRLRSAFKFRRKIVKQ